MTQNQGNVVFPPLSVRCVLVWILEFDTGDKPEALSSVLSPSETERANRFVRSEDANRFILVRGALRRILGHYLNVDPAQVRIESTGNTKPKLVGGYDRNLRFNVSHARCKAALALADGREVGIDVEDVRPLEDLEELAVRILSPTELQNFAALPSDDRMQAFFEYWSLKEAYVKGIGRGLERDLRQIEVCRSSGSDSRLLKDGADPAASNNWHLRVLESGERQTRALAVEGGGRHQEIHVNHTDFV